MVRGKILVIVPGKIVEVSKEEVFKSFLKQTVTCGLKAAGYAVCTDIIRELENLECIQVYNDNVVRLHMKAKDHYSPRTSTIISNILIKNGYNTGLFISPYVTDFRERIQLNGEMIEENELADCYINSLNLAIDKGIKTIAFPCISTGVFRFPKDKASQIAIKSVDEFLSRNKGKIDNVGDAVKRKWRYS